MPGIHVRTLGRLHWEEQDKEPILTVPGSYWLCRKNNIYKFTFKFHKSIRNTADFPYSKELMKIIRRIIKWQPRQGQHFSTKNLLVTYNHASWTRQDKMFAMMKFSDRPDAKAFSHAFVLTVKILDKTEPRQTEETMGGLVAKFDNDSPAVSSLEGEPLQERPPCKNGLKDNQEIVATSSHEGSENTSNLGQSLRTRSRHKESDNPICTISLTSLKTEDYWGDNNLTLASSLKHAALPNESEVSMIGHNKDEGVNNEANDINVSTDDADSNWQNKSEESPEMSSAVHKKRSSPVQEDENSNCSTDSQSDSASLPYQYLIERDIERERENSRNAKISKERNAVHVNGEENLCDSSVSDADAGSKSPKDSRKSSKQKSRSESRDNDSLPPPDVANLRSSDITDLVMKGLMFTIRQDKDTVTVVEQKTKLELDEVLENSEKVETKEGDPCLLNSSLLRLEKMITRMQEPPASLPEQKRNGSSENALVSFMDLANEINIDSEQRLNEAEIAEKREVDLSASDLETANCCWSQFFTDKDITDSTFDNIEKVLGDSSIYINDDNLDVDLELRIEDEEEEDIIPEALRNQEIFKNDLDALTKMPTSLPSFQDLLMDDDDQADINIMDVEGDINITTSTSNGKLNTDVTDTVKNISKLPKVISNQIITNDQIPPALLKALKSKPTVQSFQINEVNKNFNKFNEVPENNNKINMQVKVKIQDSEINNEISDVAISQKEEGNKQKDYIIYKSKDVLDGLKVSCNIEKISDKILLKSLNIKNMDTSNTDSNSTESTRLTRSNSKIFGKSNDTSVSLNVSLTNHENSLGVQMHKTAEIQHLKQERSVETRNQKLSEKSLQSSNKTSCSTFNGNSSERENLTETSKKTEDKLHVKTDKISEPRESTIKTEYLVETRSNKKSGDKQHSKSDGTFFTSNESKVEHEHVVETRSRKTGDKSIFKFNEVSSSTFNGKNLEHEHLTETRSQKSESKSTSKPDETLPEIHTNKIEIDRTIETRNKKSGDKSCLKSGETSLASNNKNTGKHENTIETRSRKQGDKQNLKLTENTSSSESIVESENSMETRSHRSGVKLYSKSIEMSSGTLDESTSKPERSVETKSKKIGEKPNFRSNELLSPTSDAVTSQYQHPTDTRSHKSDNHKSHPKSNETPTFMLNGKSLGHECSVETKSQKEEEQSHLKCNGTSTPSKSVTYERTIETRAHKLVENNPINEVNKFLLDKTVVNRKRRRSTIDQILLKRHKSSNGTDEKEVTVQVWKLLNHLRYGVKVVVERVDVNNFSR